MNIKIYIVFLLALIIHNKAFSQNDIPAFQFGITGGEMVSKIMSDIIVNRYDSAGTFIKTDTTYINNVALPYFGVNSVFKLSEKFNVKAGLQYSMRGCNYAKKIRKYRLNFFDTYLMPGFKILPSLNLEAGIQYSILYSQYYQILNGSSESGYEKIKINDYKSRPEFKVGLDLKLEKRVNIYSHLTVPLSSENPNLEIGISIYINNLSDSYKKNIVARSLEELFAEPLKYTSLVLHRKNITELPPEIGKCLNLEEIYLDGNMLTSLPKEIGNLINLKTLSVKANNLVTLPEEIGNLSNLEILKLNFNNIQHLPESIGELKGLKFLLLADNHIDYFPDEIGNLINLIELDIYNSGLISLPNSISKLKKLEKIYCKSYDTLTLLNITLKDINPRLILINKPSDY